jgi:hypothetical protein
MGISTEKLEKNKNKIGRLNRVLLKILISIPELEKYYNHRQNMNSCNPRPGDYYHSAH